MVRSVQLGVEVQPADATDKRVKWLSSNPKIASVDDSGFVMAVAPGKADITVRSLANPNVQASKTVTVVAAPAWPSKDFYSGDKKSSHVDSDDLSVLNVGIVPSQFEYGAARSTLSDLQANHKYEIRFEARYAPNSAHATGDMYVGVNKAGVIMWSAHLDLSKVTDDWVEHTVQFGPVDATQTTGINQIVTVKPDGDSTATVQLRDFRLIDVTSEGGVDDSVDPWLVSWDQLGFAGDHVDLSVSAGSYTSQWSSGRTPVAAGHTYALTLTAQGSGGTLSLHLRDQWDIGATFEATGATETYSARFTAAGDVRSLQDVCLYLDHAESDARWTVYSLRLEDLTASNGVVVGGR